MPQRSMPGTRVAPSLVIWLVIVWMLLWGTFDVATAVYGLLVALVVLVLFPLPSHRWNIFRRPHRPRQNRASGDDCPHRLDLGGGA